MSKRRNLSSLMSLTIHNVVKDLSKFNDNDLELIGQMPEHIRNKMLHSFTSNKSFWTKIEFNRIFKVLTNKHTEHLDLTLRTLDDSVLKIIEPCQNLRRLYLTRVDQDLITTQGLLSLIPHLKQIHLLRISNCDAVTDEVIDCIAANCRLLSGLDAGGCANLSDKSLISMSNMNHLMWLTFSNTQVSDEGVDYLVKGPSGENLRELRIANCPNISENILKSIALNCPRMEVIVFHNCSKVKDQTCFSFQEGSLKNLKQLNWTIEW